MALIASILIRLLSLYKIAVIAYCVCSWLHVSVGSAVRFLHQLVEPALIPARRLLYRLLPRQYMILDWSPIVVFLVIGLVKSVIRGLFL